MSRTEYLRRRYQELQRRGLCVTCAARKSNGGARCTPCRRTHTESQHRYRAEGK